MKLMLLILVLVLSSCVVASNDNAASQQAETINNNILEYSLTEAAFAQLKSQNTGQRWITIFWSIDCPSCLKELASIQKIKEQHHSLPLVFVNTDDAEDTKLERLAIINQFALQNFTHFTIKTGQQSKVRYMVDSTWYGELPRTYFIDEQGKWRGKSGLVPHEALTSWLYTN